MTKLRFREKELLYQLDEDDIALEPPVPPEPEPGDCVENLDEGFAPLDEGDPENGLGPWYTIFGTFSGPFQNGLLLTNRIEINSSFVGGDIDFYGWDTNPSPAQFYKGNAPAQLSPCGAAFTVSFDYSVNITTGGAGCFIDFHVWLIKVMESNDAAPLENFILTQEGVGSQSGSHTFSIPSGSVRDGEYVTLGSYSFVGAVTNYQAYYENFVVALG